MENTTLPFQEKVPDIIFKAEPKPSSLSKTRYLIAYFRNLLYRSKSALASRTTATHFRRFFHQHHYAVKKTRKTKRYVLYLSLRRIAEQTGATELGVHDLLREPLQLSYDPNHTANTIYGFGILPFTIPITQIP